MKRLVFCGDDIKAIEIPDNARVLRAPESFPCINDYQAAVKRAIRNPLGSPPLKELVNSSSRITIAFDDPCLPLPPMRNDLRGKAIGVLLEELYSAGVEKNRINLICANGLHRKWKDPELRFILGKRVWEEIGSSHIKNHDAENPDQMVDLGESPQGHPVHLNKAVTSSDLIIYVNINWTSMNGGWKSVLVGLGDYPSIRAHHNVKVLAEGGSVMDHASEFQKVLGDMGKFMSGKAHVFTVETVLNNRVWGAIEGSLFSLDRKRRPLALKALSLMPQAVKSALSSVMRSSYQPIAVYAGEVDPVHRKTLGALSRQQTVTVEGQTDALLMGVPNISPYSVFSRINPLLVVNTALGYIFNMYRGKPPVKKGGVLILVQPFVPGFSREHHPSYIEFFEKVLPRTLEPEEMESAFEEEFAHKPEYIESYRFGNAYHGVHPFYVWYWGAHAMKHLSRIIVVGAVDPSVPERLGFETADSMRKALDMASDTLGTGFSTTHLVIPPVFVTEVV